MAPLFFQPPHCAPEDATPFTSAGKQQLFQQALEHIVLSYPPSGIYSSSVQRGICAGPTALAYLFLQCSVRHPNARIEGHSARTWAKTYAAGSRGSARVAPGGLFSEKLGLAAVHAAITQEEDDVRAFIRAVREFLRPNAYPDEMLYGNAGVLYLLRMVRHWVCLSRPGPACAVFAVVIVPGHQVPGSAEALRRPIEQVSQRILSHAPDWTWHGKRYIGAAHGDIGIITQLVLTTPSLASEMEPTVERLLSSQQLDGNWTSRADGGSKPLIQWCHGAPGFVVSLLALRPMFPGQQDKIDVAVSKARDLISLKGLLMKEPCLCHGIFGNALALAKGEQRDRFLAFATPIAVTDARKRDGALFEPAESVARNSLIMDYWLSAAWAWLACDDDLPTVILHNDI